MASLPTSTVWTQVVATGASPIADQWTQRALGAPIDLPDGARLLTLPYAVPPVEQAQVFVNDTTLVMSAVADRSMDEGATSTFTPTISAGTNPVYSISGPAWATINASTGLVTLAPQDGNNGVTAITVSATNTCNAASRTFNVTVADTLGGADYFVVAVQGQSGIRFAMASDIGALPGTPFNLLPPASSRPTVTGSYGRLVDKDGDREAPLTLGDGIVDLEITDANYQAANGGQMVSRGAMAVAQFMKWRQPAKEPVLLVLSKSGTSMDDMFDNADTARYWQSAKSAIDYVQATYAPIDLYVHSWQGSEPLDVIGSGYQSKRSAMWMGELFSGTKHTLGNSPTNATPPTGGQAVDAYLFDVNPTADYKGILPYDTDMKIAFAFGSGPNMGDVATRASVDGLLADPRLASKSLGTYLIPTYSHVRDDNDDSPLNAMMIMGPPILKLLGETVLTPTITGMVANAGGTEVTVTVDLPHGGNLTTIRAQRSIPEPGVGEALASYLNVFGFETADPASAANSKTALTNDVWTAEITNAGTGTAPARTGTVKLTRSTAFATNTQFSYRLGGPGTSSTQQPAAASGDPRIDQAFFNYLIEEVPAWQQAGVEWPLPGIHVAAMDAMTAVTVTGTLGAVPLSTTSVNSATATLPADLVAGERVVAILMGVGGNSPAFTDDGGADWTAVTIDGAGNTGTGTQVAFRVFQKIWEAGDVAPTGTTSGATAMTAVTMMRFESVWQVGKVASAYADAATVTAPAITPLTTAVDTRHIVHIGSRSTGQTGYLPAGGLVPQGFVRIAGATPSTGARTTWIDPDPVTSLPAITTPTAFISGGGVMTIELYRT